MRKLSPGYSSEVDSVDKDTWFEILKGFCDTNIYQTWSYDAIRCGRNNISHLVLKKDGDIVAAAQVRIVKIPFITIGIAYIRWGPLWKLHGKENGIEIFLQSIRALRNEYACRRGLVLRIYPVLFDDNSDLFLSCLETEGFTRNKTIKKERTLIIVLYQPLETLRKGLKQKWRNCLNRAEKNEIEIIEGHDDKLFEKFITIYKQMLGRKIFI
jgi:lipid II:glycine glycyltransferase (peptidoglycan interpeptide bridge formation enzyme)